MYEKEKRDQFKKQFIKCIGNKCMQRMTAFTKRDYLSEYLYVELLKEGDKLFIASDKKSVLY